MINVDNGTEFTSRALDHWAWSQRVEFDFSRPGKPVDNAFIEAFNSLVRRECLSQHYFSTLAEARHVLEAWRAEYKNHRPHGSLGDRTGALRQFELCRAALREELDVEPGEQTMELYAMIRRGVEARARVATG